MHAIDFAIFILNMGAVLGVGYYFYRINRDEEDYYVGGRSITRVMWDCPSWPPMPAEAYFYQKASPCAAFWSMLSGGMFTVGAKVLKSGMTYGLDATFYGILVSAAVFALLSLRRGSRGAASPDQESSP